MSNLKSDLEQAALVKVVEGNGALKVLQDFLEGRFEWSHSGINWHRSNMVARELLRHDYTETIRHLINSHDSHFDDLVTACTYDGSTEICAKGALEDILIAISFLQNWDDNFFTEFWLFSDQSGAIIEVYHEGYATLGQAL